MRPWLLTGESGPASVAADVVTIVGSLNDENRSDIKKKTSIKRHESTLRLTCYKLREQLVVAVDDVDRDVFGRLQEQRAALQQ